MRLVLIADEPWHRPWRACAHIGQHAACTSILNLAHNVCRITTKWSEGPRIKRKEMFKLSDALQVRCRWNLECHFPDVEGHFGGDEPWSSPYELDYGSMSFEINQVDAVIEL